MKQRLSLLVFLFTFLVIFTACAAAEGRHGPGNSMGYPVERAEEKPDAAEQAAEDTVRRAVTPTADKSVPDPETAAGDTITQAQAENIALKYLGLSAEQVRGLRTEFEVEDGVPQYDVRFREGDWEYEFEISAETGRILSFDKDHRYD